MSITVNLESRILCW